MSKYITEAIYTAFKDIDVCAVCISVDGVIPKPGDPAFQTPNPECLKVAEGEECRCITVIRKRKSPHWNWRDLFGF